MLLSLISHQLLQYFSNFISDADDVSDPDDIEEMDDKVTAEKLNI